MPEQNGTAYRNFLAHSEALGELGGLEGRLKDPRTNVRESAKRKVAPYAHRILSEEDRELFPIDQLTDQHIANGISTIKGTSGQRMLDSLYNNIEEIVESVPGKTLEAMLGVKEIMQAVREEDSDIIKAYASYIGMKDLAETYESGEQIKDEKAQKMIVEKAIEGSRIEIEKKYREMGYNKEQTEIAQKFIASIVPASQSLIKKYALTGLKADVKKLQEAYENKAKEGRDVYSAIRGTLVKLARGSAQEFETVRKVLYDASRATGVEIEGTEDVIGRIVPENYAAAEAA